MSLGKTTYIFIEEDISTMERTFSLLTQQINVMCFNEVLLFCYSISSTVPDKRLWQRIAGEDDCSKIWLSKKRFNKWCWRWWQFLCSAHQRFWYIVWRKLKNICERLQSKSTSWGFFALISEVAMLLHIATSRWHFPQTSAFAKYHFKLLHSSIWSRKHIY